VILMGATSLYMLWHTAGRWTPWVVMYSINVFVTFSLSQAAMIRYWWMKETRKEIPRLGAAPAHPRDRLRLCFGILVVNRPGEVHRGRLLTVIVTGAVNHALHADQAALQRGL